MWWGKISCSDVVTWWCSDVMVGKSHAVTWWCGDTVVRKSHVVTWWHSGRGQVKWLNSLVARGKANDWLVWWQGARQMTNTVMQWLGDTVVGKSHAVMWWCGDAVVGKSHAVTWWHGDTVVEGKLNDWLVWWQGARQMTDWCGGYLIKCPSLFVLGYHWLPIATMNLVGDNREFEV